ncbi:sensor histidine kinase [Cohnella endophytica]|uniref:histidine kinase n=1 Tax=Cohnella endophytica TaxID=2419778 RepID=A0A494Y756_9BACL|nr:sensor histidine kinase [Cohnella endophytica]RKP58134.1 sensor histidine kinase [Cohnella endophytica]
MFVRKFSQRFRWGTIRLPYKLLLVYMPLILLPALAGIYSLTESYTESSKTRSSEYATNLLGLMGQKIDDRLSSYEQLSKQIMTDDGLLERISVKPESIYENFQIQNEINEKLNVFWLGSGQNVYVKAIKIETPDAHYTYGKNAINDFDVGDVAYNKQVSNGKGSALWFMPQVYSDGYEKYEAFRLGRSIRDKKLNVLGTLTIIIDTRAVTDIFSQTKFQEDVAIKLLTPDNALILDNGERIAEGERQLLTYSQNQLHNGWRLSAQLPLSQLYEPIYRIAKMAVIIVLVCIILGLVVTQLLAMDLVIPIRRLMLNMKHGIKGVRPGKLKRFGGAIEIVEMNDTFISVMYEIEQLFDEISKQEAKKKDAEIRVLQNQMSPHFLYNTLNSIRWMAMIQKQDNIKEMVDSLNQMLTYALRGKGDPVALSSEIAMLRNYVTIQKVRYQHFQFTADIPEELGNAKVPKFLLQPLIENSLIHGLSQADRPGEISVRARREDDKLLLTVEDNGIGVEAERLEEIVAGFGHPDNHFGLHSVHERIQLHYGRGFGLTMKSVSGQGTEFTLALPLQLESSQEEENDA